MKKLKIFIFSLALIVLSIQPALAKTVYYDTYGHWAEKDIEFASNTIKVFKGYGDLTFRPDNNITRSEFITILSKTAYKQNKMNEVYTSSMTSDYMSNEHWSYTYVISMYEYLNNNMDYSFTDIFKGSSFDPEKPITREEASALIAAFCKISIYNNPIPFADVEKDDQFYEEIKLLYNLGIITGYDDNMFHGSQNITRAESAALIKRVYNDINTSNNESYLTNLEFMPIKGEYMYSYFGNYDFKTTNPSHRKYLKAKSTLEYISFGGYIYPEDAHLYDLDAVKTLESLRTGGYYNVAGTNFYLIKFGEFTDAEKTKFANEILANIISRNDLTDSEIMQLISMASLYDVKENLFLDALEKWYTLTSDNNAKANILFFRYVYYVKANNQEMLRTLVFDDLKKSNNIPSLMNINWGLTPGSQSIDFENYSFTNYSYSLHKDIKLSNYLIYHPLTFNYNSKVVELFNLLLIEKSAKQNNSSLENYETIFYKYSLNRLYVLNFIGEKERAFVEGLNDYDIIKGFSIYETTKQSIDNIYTGTLKKVKY